MTDRKTTGLLSEASKVLPLTYGHVISLSLPLENEDFLVFSDGFIKNRTELRAFPRNASSTKFLRCLFRIYPSFLNTAKNRAVNMYDELKSTNQKKKEIIQDLQEKLLTEYKFNQETYEKLKNSPIVFDTPIQFLHLASNKFLSCSFHEADHEKENFRLELVEYPSDMTCFKFLPAYIHQKRSDGFIYLHDTVYIVCSTSYLNKVPYIHSTIDHSLWDLREDDTVNIGAEIPIKKTFSMGSSLKQGRKYGKDDYVLYEEMRERKSLRREINESLRDDFSLKGRRTDGFKSEEIFGPRKIKLKTLKREVNVSLDSRTLWKLNSFSPNISDENILCYGDIIWLNYSELNVTLILSKPKDSDEDVQEKLILDLVSSSFGDSYQDYVGDTNGMWIIENENFKTGGMIEWDQTLRLKHFTSGKYLSIDLRYVTSKEDVLRVVDEPDEGTLFQFTMLPTTIDQKDVIQTRNVTKDAFVKLRHYITKSWLYIEPINKENTRDNNDYEQVKQDKTLNYKIGLKTYGGDEIAFKVFRANTNEIWETNFLISCFPIIRKMMIYFVRNSNFKRKILNQEVKKMGRRIKTLIRCLNELNMFCRNQLVNTTPDQKYGTVNTFRQKVLREQYYIEYLIKLLKTSLSEEELKDYREIIKTSPKKETTHPVKKNNATLLKEMAKRSKTNQNMNFLNVVDKLENKGKKMYEVLLKQKVKMVDRIYKLLISICKDNSKNEDYVYKKMADFQSHARFFNIAVECIISIVGNNEIILNNLTDNIKSLSSSFVFNRQTQKKRTIVPGSTLKPHGQSERESTVNLSIKNESVSSISNFSYETNLVYFFLALVFESSKVKRNPDYLRFLRSICRYKNKGISINQELIYKVIENRHNSEFKKAIFMPIKIENKKMRIELIEGRATFLEELAKDGIMQQAIMEQYPYFVEQLNFFSDLALGRNYLWKTYQEKIFPIDFLFSQISSVSLPTELRSAFCNLALSLYVDHEPLNPLNVPIMCRVFKSAQTEEKNNASSSANMVEKNLFEFLVDQALNYIKDQKTSIEEELKKRCAHLETTETSSPSAGIGPTKAQNKIQVKDFLDNVLTLDIVKLLCTMVKYDILNILNKKGEFSVIVSNLIYLLEFDRTNPSYSYCLIKKRQEVLRQENIFAKNIFLKGMKGLVGSVYENFAEITKTVAGSLVGNIFGQTETKKEGVGIEGEVDYNDPLFYRNPIMKSLITLRSMLDVMINTEEHNTGRIEENMIEERKTKGDMSPTKGNKKNPGKNFKLNQPNNTDVKIKLEICDLFIFLNNLRMDFLISNFLAWFHDIILRDKSNNTRKFEKKLVEDIDFSEEISENFLCVLPTLLKTGVDVIDMKYREDESFDLLKMANNLGNMINKKQRKKKNVARKKFQNFTKEFEIPDLDTLISKQDQAQGTNYKKAEILPSLLIAFYLTKESELENKILDVIMKLFNQRINFKENIRTLEILFNKVDTILYKMLKKKIERLRILAERSEIWLGEFIADTNHNQDIVEILVIITEIQSIFYSDTTVSEDMGQIIPPSDTKKSKINKTRQIIFSFVSGHMSLVNLLKDTQNQFAKLLKDENFPFQAKKLLYDIFHATYTCLANFCKNNDANQKILFPFLNFFLDELEFDFGQMKLVSALFKNNKHLCQNISDVVKRISSNISMYGRQRRFMKFLLVIQKCNKTYLLENQISVLNQLLKSKKSDIEINFFSNFHPRYQNELILNLVPQRRGDECYTYHATFFDVLSLTTKGEEGANINLSKIKDIFHLESLIDVMTSDPNYKNPQIFSPDGSLTIFSKERSEQASHARDIKANLGAPVEMKDHLAGMKILKPAILRFISQIYFSSKKLSSNEKIFELTGKFISFFQKERDVIVRATEFSHDSPYFLYYFKDFLSFAMNYNDRMIYKDNNFEYMERDDFLVLQEIAKQIYAKLNLLERKLSEYSVSVVVKFIRAFLPDYIKEIKSKSPNLMLVDERDNARRSPEDENDMKMFQLYENFKNEYLESPELKKEIEKEREALAGSIFEIDKMFPEAFKKNFKFNLEFKDILQKLINYLQFGIANKADKGTMMNTLKVLECIIEKAPDKEQMQNFFDRFNATKMFLNVISDSKINLIENELLEHFLSFMITLLDGGNHKVQRTIYNYFNYYSKSEVLFQKFHQIFSDAVKEFSERQRKGTLGSSGKENGSVVNDINISDDDKKTLKSSILMKTLRLLQLFTEGHYLDLQNYMKYQKNSRNSYDMVSIVVELLYVYHQELSSENYENYVKCLDTLTEFVQGPCQVNQQTIIDGKFFEIANGLLSMKIPKSKDKRPPQKKKTLSRSIPAKDLERWMLEKLKYKCMILVISLVELKTDNTVIKKIMRSLPLEILKKNLLRIYKRHKKLYGNKYVKESLKHFDMEPEGDDDPRPSEFYETIIETGFNIYFLILNYLEIDIQEVDIELGNELQELESDLDKTLKSLLNLKDNVIGQLIEFSTTLISSIIYYIEVVRAKIQKHVSQSKTVQNDKDKKELYKEAIQFFARNSAHIEVVRNDKLERVHFILLPYCHYLPKESKIEFHEKVNRTSVKSKVSGLSDSALKLIEVAKHEENLAQFFSRNKFIAIFANYVKLWKDLSFFLTILLNIFIIISYGAPAGVTNEVERERNRLWVPRLGLASIKEINNTEEIFDTCGYIMIFCSSFVVLFFLCKKAPLYVKETWKDSEKENAKVRGRIGKLIIFLITVLKCVLKVLSNIEVLYYLAYGILACIASVFHPFFFAFHLTQILIRYPTLRNIIRAVWEPKYQLFLTLVLFILIEYFFTIIAYTFLWKYYDNRCENMYMCFLETYDQTFKDNGGIGSFYEKVIPQDITNYDYGRFIFDNLANYILVIILINIVSGIIIDKFGSLREKELIRTRDVQEICFICGHTRDTFERKSDKKGGFTSHIEKDHYMWNYVYFIAYLQDKEKTEYTGIESYVWAKIDDFDTSWFPIHRALALKQIEENDEELLNKKLNVIQNQVGGMRKTIKELKISAMSISNHFDMEFKHN